MNTYFIKLQGKANIPEELKVGENYRITSEGSVTQSKMDDNFDGSMNITFKYEPVTITIEKELGKTIKAADPRKNSQKIRSYLFKLYSTEGITEDFDDVYDAVTMEILSLMPQLLRSSLKRIHG